MILKKSVFILIALLAVALTACGIIDSENNQVMVETQTKQIESATSEKGESIESTEELNDMSYEEKYKALMVAGDIDQDAAEGIVDKLEALNCESYKDIKKEKTSPGTILLLTDNDDKVFCLEINENGYLGVIRENNTDGDILYFEIY